MIRARARDPEAPTFGVAVAADHPSSWHIHVLVLLASMLPKIRSYMYIDDGGGRKSVARYSEL